MSFPLFAATVAKSFQSIVNQPSEVFVADIDGDALWAAYLGAFPEGTNPLFKTRTEHDCSCCRQFVKNAGRVMMVKDGAIFSVWDAAARHFDAPYGIVARAVGNLVESAGIRDIFRVGRNDASFGAAQTRSLDKVTQKALTWDHFYTGEIPRRFRVDLPDTDRGNYRTTVQVFERGLVELDPGAVETVLGLIEGNALYRGAEHKKAVVEFQKAQRQYKALIGRSAMDQRTFVWSNAGSPAARFRNTVIGTLVQDLSEGVELEHAVKSFETKVAPANYKRTTALITPGMVKKAMATIEALGLEPALERRFAVIGDVSVNDVKWVDGDARPLMKGGLADMLAKHVATTTPAARDEEILLDDFMTRVLPETQGMELFFSGSHVGNLMALTAPVHPEPARLFRWSNDFAWSYGGNVADSIKERVKKAGGRVEGALRVSLSWFNYDDLDLHIEEPRGNGRSFEHIFNRIFYRNKVGWTGGRLDVDMNAGHGSTREPVENVIWATKPPDGTYRVIVNNFAMRETSDPGFEVEIECAGTVTRFAYNKQVRGDILVAELRVKNGVVEHSATIDDSVTSSRASQQKWGLTTEQYVKVRAVTLSPNYWGNNAVGNKHTFFVLEGCKSDEDMRGFYNEFLHPRLDEHRKVFEVIGDKTKCRPVDGQLAGLGFSSTKSDAFLVRVKQGRRQRVFKVKV